MGLINRVLSVTLLLAFAAEGVARAEVADWPQFRGPGRDAVSTETGLLKEWPAGGPKLLWKATGIGGGFSSVSLVGDRIYTMGDDKGGTHVLALERDGGKILWKTRVGEAGLHKQYPGPRSTPTVDGDDVASLSQAGDVVMLNRADGKLRWSVSMTDQLGGQRPGWNYSESVLVDGDRVVCTPGGSNGLVAALDRKTGKVIWQTQSVTDPAHYVSMIVAEVDSVRQYIQMSASTVLGIEPESGKVLWKASRRGKTAVVPSPVYADNEVYTTSGYGVGCNAFSVKKAGDGFEAKQIYADKIIANHHGGVLKVGDCIYGYSDAGGWTCQDFKTGKVIWQNKGVGKGAVVYADGMLYCRSEKGPVALVEATPEAYREKGRFNQPDRSDANSWPYPVVAGGKLYLRDQDVLLCYEVGK